MKNISSLFTSIALLIAAGGIVVLLYISLPQLEKYIRMESVRTCGQLSSYTQDIEDSSARAQYPVKEVYEECLSTLNVD